MFKPELTAIAKLILEKNYRSDEPVKTLAPLKGGEWSAAYEFSLEDCRFVIRLSHTPDNFYRDNISAQWSSADLPIPQIIKIDCYQDQHYAISPFHCGKPFEDLSATELEQTIPHFLAIMTALQSINLSYCKGFGTLTPTGEGAFHSWAEALLDVNSDRPDNLNHGWKKALAKKQDARQKFYQFYEQLEKLVPFCPEKRHLIHADLLYQNLLVDNHKVSAVIDWGCAMIGDPVYDIAMFDFFEPWFPVFTQVNLIHKMKHSFLERSPDNQLNFHQRVVACQIHLTLGNIAYCVLSNGKFDFYEHIDRLEEVLEKFNH